MVEWLRRVGLVTIYANRWVLIVVLGVSMAFASMTTSAQTSEPLACVPADRTDSAPWVWNTRILQSFPPDNPKPRFVGAFRDRDFSYELHLWQDSKGLFGELLYPVLEVDSPTSRIHDATYDAGTKTLRFKTHFPDGDQDFSGRLEPQTVTGSVVHAARSVQVVLRKLKADDIHGAGEGSYSSRAQFDCAATLYHRF